MIDRPASTGITRKEHEKVNNYILQIREKQSFSLVIKTTKQGSIGVEPVSIESF